MSRKRRLTAAQTARVVSLNAKGLQAGEIAEAVGISADSVRKILKIKKEVVNVRGHTENNGDLKKTKNIGGGGSSDIVKPSEEPGLCDDHVKNSDGIKFIGGSKHTEKGENGTMKNESEKKEKEDFEYECPKCHRQFNGDPSTCPGCGASLEV
jgi:hypothetical protein